MTMSIPRLLIVDDEAPVREFLTEALREICNEVTSVANVGEALRASEAQAFDVVLADICLPGSSGIDLLKVAEELRWNCAVILMTGHASLDVVANSIRFHAADFLLKPFSLEQLLSSVERTYQRLLLDRQQVTEKHRLAAGLRERTRELNLIQQVLRESHRSAIEAIVFALDAREPETCAHSFRVRAYARHLAECMHLPRKWIPKLSYAALLHDIGKIAVSDAILLKPGKLSPNEFESLKLHSIVGEQIVQRMGFLQEEAKIIRHHHERWDGHGYPDGLQGEQIPFLSRLFAVADTLDAMTSNRCYRSSLTMKETRDEIVACAGSQFDPRIADAFWRVSDDTWIRLQTEADHEARVAGQPDFIRGLNASPVLVELFPEAVGL